MSDNFIVRKARIDDLDGIVNVHTKCFKEYFLTNLGNEFLYRYYEQYLLDENGIGVVTISEEKITGFIIGYIIPSNALNQFYKKNFLFISRCVLTQLIKRNKVITNGLRYRLSHVRQAIKSLFMTHNSNVQLFNDCMFSKKADLMSIAILKEYRGTEVSEKLNDFFEELLLERNINEIILSVKSDNLRAVNYYEKIGYTINNSNKEVMQLSKKLFKQEEFKYEDEKNL